MSKYERFSKDESNEIFSHSPRARKDAAKSESKIRNFPWKSVAVILLSIVMLVTGSGMVLFYTTINSLNYAGGVTGVFPNNSSNTSKKTEYEGDLLNDPMILNIMLFGEDKKKTGESQGRSDTIMLISIDNRHNKIKMTTFMRDMLVYIPGIDDAGEAYGKDKINAAYTYGGPTLTIQTVEANFGIHIDRYAVVDFDSFKNIIDVLGGIELELTQDEIDYINFQTYINNQSTERYELKAEPGMVKLKGRQALWYARDRGYQDINHPEFTVSGDDFDRTERQRKMLKKLMSDFKGANVAEIIRIIGEIGPMITTNLDNDELTGLVANSMTYLKYDVEELSLPTEANYRYGWYWEQSILFITDWIQLRRDLAHFIFEDSIQENDEHAELSEEALDDYYEGVTFG
ncbi:LytR family transcriptional regulator [Clostridia bacterium]|nr:LytR family transcriptional regulator [Clostridia bacterium]